MSYLITHQPCTVCGGSGRTLHADWRLFFDGWHKAGGGSPAAMVAAQDAYFLKRGFGEPPAVYVRCTCCEGDGRMRGTISADDYAALPASTASAFGVGQYSSANKCGMAACDRPGLADQDAITTSRFVSTPAHRRIA